jgi:HAD superfamily hydrolase (TIGR01509 family)
MSFAQAVRGVIFDMDGLLVDTERVYYDALLGAALSVERDMPHDFVCSMIGVPGPECVAMIKTYYGDGFPMERFDAEYDRLVAARLAESIPLRAGARELVTYLSGRGIPQAIATSSRRPTVERYMNGVGLLEHFSAIVCREDVVHAKPAPDPFLKAAALLGLEPGECLVLEDSYHGIAGAHAAGAMPIMVPDLLTATEAVCAQCVAVADDLHAVKAMLEQAGDSGLQESAAAAAMR